MRPQPVVTHVVRELDADTEEPFAGAELEGRDHVDVAEVVAAVRAHPLVTDRAGGPPVG